MRGGLLASLALLGVLPPVKAEEPPTFLVGDVKHGRDPAPTGKVRIWALRSGMWLRTEEVDASTVNWTALLDNDRIEVVP